MGSGMVTLRCLEALPMMPAEAMPCNQSFTLRTKAHDSVDGMAEIVQIRGAIRREISQFSIAETVPMLNLYGELPLTLEQAAAECVGNCGKAAHPETVRRWIKKGVNGVKLEHKRQGRRYLIFRSA